MSKADDLRAEADRIDAVTKAEEKHAKALAAFEADRTTKNKAAFQNAAEELTAARAVGRPSIVTPVASDE